MSSTTRVVSIDLNEDQAEELMGPIVDEFYKTYDRDKLNSLIMAVSPEYSFYVMDEIRILHETELRDCTWESELEMMVFLKKMLIVDHVERAARLRREISECCARSIHSMQNK